MHGSQATGPRTPEGRQKISEANWKHGRYSNQEIARRKSIQKARAELREDMQGQTITAYLSMRGRGGKRRPPKEPRLRDPHTGRFEADPNRPIKYQEFRVIHASQADDS